MQTRKNLIKLGVLSGISILVLVLGGSLVVAKQSQKDKVEAQGYVDSNSNNAQVLGTSSDPNPTQNNTQQSTAQSNTSSSTPTSPPADSGTSNNSTTPPKEELVQVDPIELYHTQDVGVLAISIQTDVGGQACGFPNGYCKWKYAANVVVKNAKGTVVASSSSAVNFHTFELPVGKYTVHGQDGDAAHEAPAPVEVTVTNGQISEMTLFYEPLVMTN